MHIKESAIEELDIKLGDLNYTLRPDIRYRAVLDRNFLESTRRYGPDATLYRRVVNIMSHGNYSFCDPVELLEENRQHFEKVLGDFLNYYPFNRASLPGMDA